MGGCKCGCSHVNALVIGYGSIGARHARLLTEFGCHTAVVSARQLEFPFVYSSLEDALATEQPEYVVVANSTNKHHSTLSELARLGYAETLLVEKPVFANPMPVPPHTFRNVFVAYNLRFHRVIQRLRRLLDGESILSVQAYVGQYLPDWRPAIDYRASYSASAEQGGGALRDLSHELDYLTWMFGGWERVTALGGHYSPLEITSDDVFVLIFVTSSCPVVTLQVNYLDRLTRRFVLVNTARHTFEADLINGTIMIDRDRESLTTERDYTYRAMHRSVLSGETDTLCSLAEGLDTMRLIEAAEHAAQRGEWVVR